MRKCGNGSGIYTTREARLDREQDEAAEEQRRPLGLVELGLVRVLERAVACKRLAGGAREPSGRRGGEPCFLARPPARMCSTESS